MSDNVIKFRRPEKKPETEAPKPKQSWPSWLPFAVLVAVAVGIYFIQS
jgi:hypothetical protein